MARLLDCKDIAPDTLRHLLFFHNRRKSHHRIDRGADLMGHVRQKVVGMRVGLLKRTDMIRILPFRIRPCRRHLPGKQRAEQDQHDLPGCPDEAGRI